MGPRVGMFQGKPSRDDRARWAHSQAPDGMPPAALPLGIRLVLRDEGLGFRI